MGIKKEEKKAFTLTNALSDLQGYDRERKGKTRIPQSRTPASLLERVFSKKKNFAPFGAKDLGSENSEKGGMENKKRHSNQRANSGVLQALIPGGELQKAVARVQHPKSTARGSKARLSRNIG